MNRKCRFALGLLVVALAGLATLAGLQAQDRELKKASDAKSETPAKSEAAATPVKPKPLTESVRKGLAFLVGQQHENGGWGQGGGWRMNLKENGGRVEGKDVADPPDVANTCIATLALLRAGNTPKDRAAEFICTHVEKSDKKSLYVTDVRDTQVQTKIGPYIDTFLSSLVMAELKGKMQDDKAEQRLVAALNKVIGKMEDNQLADGSFPGNNGWASILSQGVASKGLNRAAQAGAVVKGEVLDRDNKQSAEGLDKKTGKFGSPDAGAVASGRGVGGIAGRGSSAPTTAPRPSDAGVGLYNSSARAGGLQETVNTLKGGEKKARETLESTTASKVEKDKATSHLERLAMAEESQKAAVRGIVLQLEDKQFVAGFGSNGGEEFLSFMNISETLLAKGGADWEKWDKTVTESINRVQDKDGGWSGNHCITGRTFCTAGALLVLLADRAPVPTVAKMQGKK
jgi:hypothetical protein